jgi:hypothetical protein
MKQLLRYIVPAALFGLLVWIYIAQEQKSIRTHEKHLKRIVALQNENDDLKKRSDSLLDLSITLDVQMDELEGKADSLALIAETLEMPCEHELELRKRETEFVRAALEKCKESKAIQTTRVGLSEIRVENQVELCGEMMVVKKDFKQEKRKSFFKGMGTGGLLVGILIILAL